MDKIERLQRVARFYYLRTDIQECLADFAKNREIATQYVNGIFGKRPDAIVYPNDVTGQVLKGATSFHCSEELWSNPLELGPELNKIQLDKLREGWDLILDIDCNFIEYSKVAAKLLVEALYFHNVQKFGVKFSGRSGFHLGISWNAFPKKINEINIKDFFPDGPRIIAAYLKEMIANPLRDRILEMSSLREISESLKIKMNDLMENNTFNPFKIVNIDTVLISPRHLFRMPYSLNEKSGLVSIVIKPEQVSLFHPGWAHHDRVFPKQFLPEPEKNEARELLVQALDWQASAIEKEKRRKQVEKIKTEEKSDKKFTAEKIDSNSITEEMYPPCIRLMLQGMKQDGRKRALFVLINFFRSLSFSFEDIDKKLGEWNKKNHVPLRENYIKAQLSWFKRQDESGKRLPPNCSLDHYYKEIGVCVPDGLCSKIKNPVNYTIRKLRFSRVQQKYYKKKTEKYSKR